MRSSKAFLFATTNLTANLDKAFERRFLLKIYFPLPDARVRQQIWLSKLPELNPEMAETLSRKYSFTCGQTENQVKQLIIKRILDPGTDLMQALADSSQKESGFEKIKPIGFHQQSLL